LWAELPNCFVEGFGEGAKEVDDADSIHTFEVIGFV
jgi:hypothetical protein